MLAEAREDVRVMNLSRPLRGGAWNAEWKTQPPAPRARHVRRRGYVQPDGDDRRFYDEAEWGNRRPEWHWWAYVRMMRRLRNAASVLAMKA